MVAHLIGLKFAMLRNGARRSPRLAVMQVLILIVALTLLVGFAVAGTALHATNRATWDLIHILGGALICLAWWIAPVLTLGFDDSLTPRTFTTFGIRRTHLVVGLGLAALVGLPGLITTAGTVLAAGIWLPAALPALAATVMIPLALATCVLGSRVLATALGVAFTSRRLREIASLTLLLFLITAPLILRAATPRRAPVALTPDADPSNSPWLPPIPDLPTVPDLDQVTHLAGIVSWTPLGAVWAVPSDVAQDLWLRAAGHSAIAVGTVVVLVLLWDRLLRRAMIAPVAHATHPPHTHAAGLLSHALFGAGPTTPRQAVAARCLTYWVRDARYRGALTLIPVLPLALYTLSGGSDTVLMLVLAPLIAFLLGWTISADIAYDSTAFWLHLTSGLSGRDDRAGRALAVSVLAVPILLATIFITAWFTGLWELLPVTMGLSAGIYLTSIGLASVTSASFISVVPQPGDSPFSSPRGGTMSSILLQNAAGVALLILIIPNILLAIIAVRTGMPTAALATLALGFASGAVVARVGIEQGGRIYDARGPELMQALAERG